MGRLFWKIFIWFWLALALLNFTVGWAVKFYVDQHNEHDDRTLKAQVTAVAVAFEQGDTNRARTLLREIINDGQRSVYVFNPAGEDVLGRPIPEKLKRYWKAGKLDERRVYHSHISLDNGSSYSVVAPRRPFHGSRLAQTPMWLGLMITLVISTLVCYWLANYLSRPIRQLSAAAQRLSTGDFDTRIGSLKRRDELADLSKEFDQMADRIQQLLQSRKQLIQDISHELRSPLARLQVALALAERNGESEQGNYQRIARDLHRLEALIDEILTLSQLDSVNYSREAVDIGELVESIVDNCRIEAAQKGCRINTNITPGLVVHGNTELLHRAVENIIRNAITFTKAHSDIDVSVYTYGNSARIAVLDQGPGVPPGSQESLFEPFVRLDQARQHNTGGYGLGLSIARKAVTLHNGDIVAENHPGGGLQITITLPLQKNTKTEG